MHTIQTLTPVKANSKTSSDSAQRCDACGRSYDRCNCRWTIGPQDRLISRAKGAVRVLATTRQGAWTRLTTGRTVRRVTFIQGGFPSLWLVTSTPMPSPLDPDPLSQRYTLVLDDEDCDCPDSQRRRNAGLAIGHPLRACKHLNALKALLAAQA